MRGQSTEEPWRAAGLAAFVTASRCLALSVLLATTGVAGCASPHRANGEEPGAAPSPVSFSVYTLSRGAGVPQAAREALQTTRELLEKERQRGTIARLEETRIGLEGERRLCVEIDDRAAGQRLLEHVRALAKDTELFDVVEEPCSKP